MGKLQLNLFGTINSGTERSDFSRKRELLRDYYVSLVETLNLQVTKLNASLRFEVPAESDLLDLVGRIPSADKFEEQFEKIYPEQIVSAFEVMNSIAVEDQSHEHVTGLTQMGKSGLITVLMDFLGIVSYVCSKKSKILLPVAWLPNAINLEKQSIEKLSQSSMLIGSIACHIDGESILLKDFNNYLKTQVFNRISQNLERKSTDGTINVSLKNQLLGDISDFFGPVEARSALVLRRSTVNTEVYKWLFQAANEFTATQGSDAFPNVNIALVMDESHIAIGKGQRCDIAFRANLDDRDEDEIASIPQDQEDLDDSECMETEEFDLTEAEQDQAQEERQEYEQNSVELAEIANTYTRIFANQAKLITVSATNTPWLCIHYKQGKKPVYLKVANGYCGFPFVDGHDYPLDPGIQVVEPIVKPMRDLSDVVPYVKHLNLRHLDNPVSYATCLEVEDWQTIEGILNANMEVLATRIREDQIRRNLRTFTNNGHSRNRAAKTLEVIFRSKARELLELSATIMDACQLSKLLNESEFRSLFSLPNAKKRKEKLSRLCQAERSLDRAWRDSYSKAQQALRNLLKYLLLDENPQNKRGCILRWECNNDSFDSFIRPLESELGNRIRFIPYLAASAKQTVPQLLSSVNPDGKPYVIVVTGRGRYGESYPSDCGYAIDGTTKNASAAAFFQSLLGRISGYRKYDPRKIEETRPMLILSDLCYDQVFLELKKGKGFSPKVGTGTNLVKTGVDSRVVELVRIVRNTNDPVLEEFFRELDSELQPYRGSSLGQISKTIQADLFQLIEPIAAHAECNPQIVLASNSGIPSDVLGEGVRFLRPGEATNDETERMLDWRDRIDTQVQAPTDSRSFVALEFSQNSGRRFSLTSTRNNRKGLEYLHTGLQLCKENYRVNAVWLWLKTPICSTVNGPVDGAVRPKVGSVPGYFYV